MRDFVLTVYKARLINAYEVYLAGMTVLGRCAGVSSRVGGRMYVAEQIEGRREFHLGHNLLEVRGMR